MTLPPMSLPLWHDAQPLSLTLPSVKQFFFALPTYTAKLKVLKIK